MVGAATQFSVDYEFVGHLPADPVSCYWIVSSSQGVAREPVLLSARGTLKDYFHQFPVDTIVYSIYTTHIEDLDGNRLYETLTCGE